jgi:hypothetical protein
VIHPIHPIHPILRGRAMAGADRTVAADQADASREDADAGEIEARQRRARSWRGLRPHVRRWATTVLGLVVVVGAWRVGISWVYVLGVLVTLIGAVKALHGRWILQLAAVVAVGGVSLGGPWLGVRMAYEPVGVEVPRSVESYAHYVTTVDDATIFYQEDRLTAVGGDGSELWTSDLIDLRYILPVTDDRLVTVLRGVLVGVDDEAGRVWSRLVVWEDDLAAQGDGVVVLRSCVTQEGEPARCTWTGVEVVGGETAWETSGLWAPGWSAVDAQHWDDYVRALPAALFVVRDESGFFEVREAATGNVVQRLPDDDTAPVLVGDDVLVVQQSGECSIALLRDGEPEWTSAFDCAQWRDLEYSFATPGVVVGDTFWAQPVEDVGTLVVDLRDGTVRTAGYSYWGAWYPYGSFDDREPVHVLGAGVEAQVGPGGVVVRDPSSGDRLWSVAVRDEDVRSVQVAGEVLVLSRYVQPLLLHEWFAPEDRARIAVEVYDVRSGELRATARPEGYPWAPLLAGDRVVLDVGDLDGDVTLRMIGG